MRLRTSIRNWLFLVKQGNGNLRKRAKGTSYFVRLMTLPNGFDHEFVFKTHFSFRIGFTSIFF